jgi:predicted CxxxxCH...CXXCH cytochrome family protein
VVPVSALAAGHVDLPPPAPVFPAGWSGGLARHDGTAPVYDPGTATCSNVYCHGNGAFLVAADRSPGLVRSPRWTGGETQAFCGSCHGTPPLDGKLGHTIATSLGTCAQCHGLSVNPDGGIRFVSLPDGGLGSFHLDGVVNGNN